MVLLLSVFVLILFGSTRSQDYDVISLTTPLSDNIFLDSTCTTVVKWFNDPMVTFAEANYCVTFRTRGDYAVKNGTGASYVFMGEVLPLYAVLPITSFARIPVPSLTKTSAVFGPGLNSAFGVTGFDVTTGSFCGSPSTTISNQGFTKFDCCVNITHDTCIYFRTGDTRFLPVSPRRCVSSYDGMGSVLGTPCQSYYSSESPYYTAVMPTSGNLYTDYGTTPQVPRYGCYVENWSGYRDWGTPYDYKADLDACDYIYYAFYTYEEGRLREPHDETNLIYMVSQGYKVLLTIGGWNFNATLANDFWLTSYTSRTKYVIDLVVSMGLYGVDVDIEWPGQRGYSVDRKTEFMTNVADFCSRLSAVNKACFIGVLGVGGPYDPSFYQHMSQVDQVNVFGYDMAGCFDTSKPFDQAQIQDYEDFKWSVHTQILNLLPYFPASKLSIGFPQYTRGYYFSRVSTKSGCFPPAVLAGLREDGVDVIREHNGDLLPEFCITDPFSYVEESETNPGAFVCRGVATVDGELSDYIIPFWRYSTFQVFKDMLAFEFGIVSYYTYAHSMDHGVSKSISALLKAPTLYNTNGPSYAFPSGTNSGVISCPGIVYFTPTIIVTSLIYQGCTRPDGIYCYFPIQRFSCQPSTQFSRPNRTRTICPGVDTTTLLPAKEYSKRVICEDMTLYVQEVSVCSGTDRPVTEVHDTVIPVNIASDFQTYVKEIYGDPIMDYSVVRLPRLCEDFSKPLTCMEFVCRDDLNCMYEFRSSPFFAVCQPIGDALNEYDFLLQEVVGSYELMESIKLKMLIQSERYHLGQVSTKRFLGAIIGGLLGFAMGSLMGGGKDYSGDIQTLTHNQAQTANRVDALERTLESFVGNYNTMQANLASFASNVTHRFDAVESAINDVIREQQEFQAKVASKFDRIDKVLVQLAQAITQVDRKLELYGTISAATTAYTAHIITLMSRLSTFGEKIQRVSQQLAVCYGTLVSGSFSGCTDSLGEVHPLAISTTIDSSGDTLMVFIYLTRPTVERQSYRASRTYCSDGNVFVAAQGCTFVQVNDQIMHKDDDLGSCVHPYFSYKSNCDPYSITIAASVRPSGSSIDTGFVNLTGVVNQDLEDLKQQIDNITGFDFESALKTINFSYITDASEKKLLTYVQQEFEKYEPTYYGVTVTTSWWITLGLFGLLVILAIVTFALIGYLQQQIDALSKVKDKTV